MIKLQHLILFVALNGALFAQGHKPGEYRDHALRHEGDVTRGAALFQSDRLLCSKCHSVDGSANKAGPDLRAAGDAFGRRDLVEAVMNPSRSIAPGYGAWIVETRDGKSYLGTLKNKSEDKLALMGMDGTLVTLAKEEIRSQAGSPVSLMPPDLQSGLTRDEFTDLIEYLASLKEPESSQLDRVGAPRQIPVLEKPITLEPVFSKPFVLPRGKAETGLSSFRQVPGFPKVFLVLHQKGVIWRAEQSNGKWSREVFLDLKTEVFSDRGPNGLLDVCFHPKFRENRKYYLFYQVLEGDEVVTRIVERIFDDNFKEDSGHQPREIIRITSVADDHSGGCLAFGPDGFLYFGMGDTGPHHDPNGHAQNPGLLLGKMMRIDVDRRQKDLPYAIPKDNPFAGKPGIRPEIWAYGLRNPWRFCFDKKTGELWLADVGQDRGEEVSLIRKGGNYGWNVYEGFERFSNEYRQEGEDYLQPLFAYRRKYGNSITGGHVYRAEENLSFQGVYLCGDFNSKKIFGVFQTEGVLTKVRELGVIPQRLVSFTEDEEGNYYAVGYEGMVYRLNFNLAEFN